MPTTTPLTDAINALTTYSNTVTGEFDQTLSDAVATLAAGYGGSDIIQQFQDGTYDCGIPYVAGTVGYGCNHTTFRQFGLLSVQIQDLTIDPATDTQITFFVCAKDLAGVNYPAVPDDNRSYILLLNSAISNYYDFVNWNSEHTRNATAAGSNGIRMCLPIFQIEKSYAFIPQTGRVLFAGKQSPYYGMSNISEAE